MKNWNRVYDLSVGFFCGWKPTSRHHGEMSWLDTAPSRKLCSALLWAHHPLGHSNLPCFRTAWNTSKIRVFTSALFFRAWPTSGIKEAVLRNVSDEFDCSSSNALHVNTLIIIVHRKPFLQLILDIFFVDEYSLLMNILKFISVCNFAIVFFKL